MLIDDKVLDDLARRAQNSPRRRMNYSYYFCRRVKRRYDLRAKSMHQGRPKGGPVYFWLEGEKMFDKFCGLRKK